MRRSLAIASLWLAGSLITFAGASPCAAQKPPVPKPSVASALAWTVQPAQEWWYVPVRPSVQPPKRCEYYEALAEVENEMQKPEGITLLLVPTALEAEPAAAS